jgi:hypothetical protein
MEIKVVGMAFLMMTEISMAKIIIISPSNKRDRNQIKAPNGLFPSNKISKKGIVMNIRKLNENATTYESIILSREKSLERIKSISLFSKILEI